MGGTEGYKKGCIGMKTDMPCGPLVLYCAVLTGPPGGHTQAPPLSCCSAAIQEPGSPGCHTALGCHNTWLFTPE